MRCQEARVIAAPTGRTQETLGVKGKSDRCVCALYTRRARLLHPLLPAFVHHHVCRSACIPAQYAQYTNGLYAGGTNSLYLYLGATLDTCAHGYKVLNTRDDYSNSGGWVRMCDSAKEVCATYTITTATGATRAITTITSSWPLWSPEKWSTAKSNGAHAAVTLTGDTSAFNVRYTVHRVVVLQLVWVRHQFSRVV